MKSFREILCEIFMKSCKIIPNALLYCVTEDGELQYNVVSTSSIHSHVCVTGCGINKLESLKHILGTTDSPAREFSVSSAGRTLGKAVIADLALNRNGTVIAISIQSILERPIVGISWKSNLLPELYLEFAEILERNGAYAVFLPCVKSIEEADSVFASIDGILMTGGGDFSPTTFGQKQTPHGSQGWSNARDKSDLLMIRQALTQNIPLLGICRGMQGMNIAMGGSIIQDIPFYLGQKLLAGNLDPARISHVLSGTLPGATDSVPDKGYRRHFRSAPYFRSTYQEETDTYLYNCGCKEGHLRIAIDGLHHSRECGPGYHSLHKGHDNGAFVIDKSSKWLYPLLKQETMEFITSTHHQAVDPDHLGEGISIAAIASDGIIEAIEYTKNLFALGVQWHPERDALKFFHGFAVDQQLCNAPLRGLVDYARIYQKSKYDH